MNASMTRMRRSVQQGSLLAPIHRGSAGGFTAAGRFHDAPVHGEVLQRQADHLVVCGAEHEHLDQLVEHDPIPHTRTVTAQRVGIEHRRD